MSPILNPEQRAHARDYNSLILKANSVQQSHCNLPRPGLSTCDNCCIADNRMPIDPCVLHIFEKQYSMTPLRSLLTCRNCCAVRHCALLQALPSHLVEKLQRQLPLPSVLWYSEIGRQLWQQKTCAWVQRLKTLTRISESLDFPAFSGSKLSEDSLHVLSTAFSRAVMTALYMIVSLLILMSDISWKSCMACCHWLRVSQAEMAALYVIVLGWSLLRCIWPKSSTACCQRPPFSQAPRIQGYGEFYIWHWK